MTEQTPTPSSAPTTATAAPIAHPLPLVRHHREGGDEPTLFEVVIWEHGRWVNDWDGQLHTTVEGGWAEVVEARQAGYDDAALAVLTICADPLTAETHENAHFWARCEDSCCVGGGDLVAEHCWDPIAEEALHDCQRWDDRVTRELG